MVEYQSIWPEQFQREAERIQGALGPRALGIDHVGSTPVPGLAAKPIIDFDCSKDLKSTRTFTCSVATASRSSE